MESSPGLHAGCSRTITYQSAHSVTVTANRQGARVQTVLFLGGELAMTVYDKDQPKMLWQDSERV